MWVKLMLTVLHITLILFKLSFLMVQSLDTNEWTWIVEPREACRGFLGEPPTEQTHTSFYSARLMRHVHSGHSCGTKNRFFTFIPVHRAHLRQGSWTKLTNTREKCRQHAGCETYLYSISDNLVTNHHQRELAASQESSFIPDLYRKHECSITETDCLKTAALLYRFLLLAVFLLYDTMVNYDLAPSFPSICN